MGKKAQISAFVIIGLVIVVVMIGFFVSMQARQEKDLTYSSESIFSIGPKQSNLEAFVHDCVKQTVIEAELEYGLHPVWSTPEIKQYLLDNLPDCFDNFELFKAQDFKVDKGVLTADVEITHEALVVELNYPLTFTRDAVILNIDHQTYRFPRTVMEEINFEGTTRVVSADGTLIMEVPPGTDVTLNGEPVSKIGIKQLDREFNGNNNGVVAGMLAFNGLPDGAIFSKPIKVIGFYRESTLGWVQEEDLKLGFWDEEGQTWVGVPTEVDTEKNKITAQMTHFTGMTQIQCGESESSTIEIKDVIAEASCTNCNGPPWSDTFDTDCSIIDELSDSYEVWAPMVSSGFSDLGYIYQEACEAVSLETRTVNIEEGVKCMENKAQCTEIKERCDEIDGTIGQCLTGYTCSGMVKAYVIGAFLIQNTDYELQLMQEEGDGCVFQDGDTKKNDAQVFTGGNNQNPNGGVTLPDGSSGEADIFVEGVCTSNDDGCRAEVGTHALSGGSMKFSLNAINNGALPDVCLSSDVKVTLKGVGIIGSKTSCDPETDKEPTCKPDSEKGGEGCFVCKAGAEGEPAFWEGGSGCEDCKALGNGGGGGGELGQGGGGNGRGAECSAEGTVCEGVIIEPGMMLTISDSSCGDTRDKKRCDVSFDVTGGTDFAPFRSEMVDGECWIFGEIQQVTDGYKPDIYVRESCLSGLTCETDDDCKDDKKCIDGTCKIPSNRDEISMYGFSEVPFDDISVVKELYASTVGEDVSNLADMSGYVNKTRNQKMNMFFRFDETAYRTTDKRIDLANFEFDLILDEMVILGYLTLSNPCDDWDVTKMDIAELYSRYKEYAGSMPMIINFDNLECLKSYIEDDTADICEIACGDDTSSYFDGKSCFDDPSCTVPCVETTSCTKIENEVIEISNFIFENPEREVMLGNMVTWDNNDEEAHRIKVDEIFEVIIEPGETYSHLFETTGEYSFYSPTYNFMKGTLTVIPSGKVVTINNYIFSPLLVSVDQGIQVTWINKDPESHNIKSDYFDETLQTGESYTHVFNTEEIVDYNEPDFSHMTGSISVSGVTVHPSSIMDCSTSCDIDNSYTDGAYCYNSETCDTLCESPSTCNEVIDEDLKLVDTAFFNIEKGDDDAQTLEFITAQCTIATDLDIHTIPIILYDADVNATWLTSINTKIAECEAFHGVIYRPWNNIKDDIDDVDLKAAFTQLFNKPQELTKKEHCEENDGTWISAEKECEGLTEALCTEKSGIFSACESACRHDDPPEPCDDVCVDVCSFAPLPVATPEEMCTINSGTWLGEHSECEGITETLCTDNGWTFATCESACRHDDPPEPCADACVDVCLITTL